MYHITQRVCFCPHGISPPPSRYALRTFGSRGLEFESLVAHSNQIRWLGFLQQECHCKCNAPQKKTHTYTLLLKLNTLGAIQFYLISSNIYCHGSITHARTCAYTHHSTAKQNPSLTRWRGPLITHLILHNAQFLVRKNQGAKLRRSSSEKKTKQLIQQKKILIKWNNVFSALVGSIHTLQKYSKK